MTDIKDTLAALSEAATPGPWHVQDGAIGVNPWISCSNGTLENGKYVRGGCILNMVAHDQNSEDAAFIAAIVNAYRSGQLVPVPSVETVARAIYEADDPWHIAFPWPNPDGLGMAERYREIATAVRAALAGEQ